MEEGWRKQGESNSYAEAPSQRGKTTWQVTATIVWPPEADNSKPKEGSSATWEAIQSCFSGRSCTYTRIRHTDTPLAPDRVGCLGNTQARTGDLKKPLQEEQVKQTETSKPFANSHTPNHLTKNEDTGHSHSLLRLYVRRSQQAVGVIDQQVTENSDRKTN